MDRLKGECRKKGKEEQIKPVRSGGVLPELELRCAP